MPKYTEDQIADAAEGAIALSRNLDCIYHRHRQMSRAARAFFDLLCQHADT